MKHDDGEHPTEEEPQAEDDEGDIGMGTARARQEKD